MDSPDRVAEAAWLHKLGPEAESLLTKGGESAPVVRKEIVDQVVLLLRSGQNVALVGPEGVGKRSVALTLRRSAAWGDDFRPTLDFDEPVAHPLSWPVFCTKVRHWIAGSYYVGNLENRIHTMLTRVRKPAVVLLDSAPHAIGAWQGRGDVMDLVDLLVDVAAHPRIAMVVTATPEGWGALRERKPDFAAQFVEVDVPAPAETQAREIAMRELRRGGIEVEAAKAAVDEAFVLAGRHFGAEPVLAPALRLLRAAASNDGMAGGVAFALRAVCAAQLGVARCWVGRDFAPPASSLVARLEETVLGQHDAVTAVVDDLIAWVHGLGSPGRPRSYVFAGPPGIGKTSLACAFQQVVGGPESSPLRFDCSELPGPQDAKRLLDVDEPDSLAGGLMSRPGAVVLFDEVDRAHPLVRGLLYQLLEGRLTTLEGRHVPSANATVIMTTNAGEAAWMRPLAGEKERDDARAATVHACADMLGAAITSRVTRVLVFPPLSNEDGRSIVELELQRIASRPDLRERHISVSATPRLVEALARSGVSSRSGARGVQKTVYVAVAVPVAQFINERHVARSRLVVDAVGRGDELDGVRIELERWN